MRKATPRGQMTRGANSGPAIMLMPPAIRATFMPNPPLKPLPTPNPRPFTKQASAKIAPLTGVAAYMKNFEAVQSVDKKEVMNAKVYKKVKAETKAKEAAERLKPTIEAYRKEQEEAGGEYKGMNCYKTLFVGRLAYEVTERKLLKEFEVFGPVKYLKLITDQQGKSRGYAFVEYESEEDFRRAFRKADAMRLEGRPIVVDVERGHTVPDWLPRRLGGGLGGTRIGDKRKNISMPGRFDPVAAMNRERPPSPRDMGPPPGYYDDRGPPPGYRDDRYRGPPPPPGPPGRHDDRGGGFDRRDYRDRYDDGPQRRRDRSRSPPRSRRRY